MPTLPAFGFTILTKVQTGLDDVGIFATIGNQARELNTMGKMSVHIDEKHKKRLEEESRLSGRKESDIVRDALDQYFAARSDQETCLDLARRIGVVGHAKDLAPDLSINKAHFQGFGGE